MKTVACILLVAILHPLLALGEEPEPPPPPPPPTVSDPAATPSALPQLPELEQRGRQKMKLGSILMGIGVVAALVGVFLLVDSSDQAMTCAKGGMPGDCASSEGTAGAWLVAIGGVSLLASIPIMIVGSRQVLASRDANPIHPETSLRLTPLPGGAMVRWGFAF